MAKICVPENKVEIDFEQAYKLFRSGETVLATVEDEDGIYAAGAYSKSYDHTTRDLTRNPEFQLKGRWYHLPKEES